MPFWLHDLYHRSRLRQHDGDRDPQPSAVIGQPLRMIAGRCGDHALVARLITQQQQPVESAAFLVSRRELKVFELQIDLRPDNAGKRRLSSVGVRTMEAAIRSCAARISSILTGSADASAGIVFCWFICVTLYDRKRDISTA